jgi:hypothetical protein
MNRILSPTWRLCETGRVVDRIAVWPNTFVSNDLLKYSISELRQVFEDDAREPRVIQTIPKCRQAAGSSPNRVWR